MKRHFKFKDSANRYEAWFEVSNTCPHCGRTEMPSFVLDDSVTTANRAEKDSMTLIEIYQCTYTDCQKYFLKAYKYQSDDNYGSFQFSEIPYNYSGKHFDVVLPDEINRISQNFVEVYTQAAKAESLGLDQLSGMGYRKALEFLIKDYAISKSPADIDSIKANFLGKVIANNLKEFPKIQNLAKAANWIGTDQAHYEPRFSNNDLESMKQFILATATFMSADYQAENAMNFVEANDPKNNSGKEK